MLSSKIGGWEIEIVGENADESPYVAMTSKLLKVFPENGGTFQIEPDASSGSYFWAVNYFYSFKEMEDYLNSNPKRQSPVYVLNWPYKSDWQIDSKFPKQAAFFAQLKSMLEKQNDAGDNSGWRAELRRRPLCMKFHAKTILVTV